MDNIVTLNLDGNVLKSKEELHSTISWQLELPDYYGHNLDALWDMLSTWSKPLSIEVTHAEQFIANLGDYADALFGLLHDAADENKEVILNIS
jgi:ribonuclease inhibitor